MIKQEQYPLISRIHSPADFRRMTDEEILPLAEEIRRFLLEKIPETGGHLASNLGVVELTMALHRVFHIPEDHLIFDVGHQSYVHKILTGRAEEFDTLRKPGGLSGFTRREESPCDPFGAGHASTSLSAALGFAYADRLAGKESYAIPVIGDGAYTGGMIHEALNNVDRNLRLVVILNENEMSISRNIGGFARYIAKVRNSRHYRRVKTFFIYVLRHIPLLGKPLYRGLRFLKHVLKNRLYSSNYFEELGLYYCGPVDGNDFEAVVNALRQAKAQNESVILHVKTQKGKGYPPAEEHPENYHSVYPSVPQGLTFSEALGQTLCRFAESDESVTAVTAAMREGTGLLPFFQRQPQRAFDVGIAEGHALTFSAALAAAGMKPFTAIYSTFLQRGYDSLLHDIALQRLPVRILIDRAGLAYADGPTHHGIFDVAFLSEMPGFEIYAPLSVASFENLLSDSLKACGPVAIRYEHRADHPDIVGVFFGRGKSAPVTFRIDFSPDDALDGLIFTYGAITAEALRAAGMLRAKGKKIGVVALEKLAPYAAVAQELLPILPADVPFAFLEEGVYAGGAGMLLFDALRKAGVQNPTEIFAVRNGLDWPDAPCADLRAWYHIAAEDVAAYFDR